MAPVRLDLPVRLDPYRLEPRLITSGPYDGHNSVSIGSRCSPARRTPGQPDSSVSGPTSTSAGPFHEPQNPAPGHYRPVRDTSHSMELPRARISQTINGSGDTARLRGVLLPGGRTAIPLLQAATTEQWKVGLGDTRRQARPHSSRPNAAPVAERTERPAAFTGWHGTQTLYFTADCHGSEVLSFLAIGTPNGVPPFALLDGVTLTTAVPEPSTLSLMVVGLLGLGAVRPATACQVRRGLIDNYVSKSCQTRPGGTVSPRP